VRDISAYPVEPTEVELAHARTLIIVHKTTTTPDGTVVHSRQVYISSLSCKRGCAKRFAKLIRGHWAGSEILNHWIRDHIFREDQTRSKNWKLNANLALTRAALISLKGQLLPDKTWPEIKQRAQYDISFAYQLVSNHAAK
jgi:predicted transposase YbfD/YdcC